MADARALGKWLCSQYNLVQYVVHKSLIQKPLSSCLESCVTEHLKRRGDSTHW